VAWDSLSAAPLVGALVQFASETDPALAARSTVTDSRGRWRIDTMPVGPYVGGFFHPTLDALGLEPPSFRVRLQGDSTARLDLAIPGPVRLRTLLCGAPAANDSSGGIIGVLRDADRQESLDGATLSVAWRELTIERGSIRNQLRRVPVAARSTGVVLACGVPTDTPVEVDAAAPGRASGVVEVRVPVRGMARRDMLLTDSATARAVALAAADTAAGDAIHRRGLRVADGATLRGTVTGPDGRPLARVQLSIAGTGRTATTGPAGTFAMDSLPLGTFGLDARALGLTPVRRPVDLLRGQPTTVTLALTERVQALSSVVVRGQRSRTSTLLEEFAERRRRAVGGKFLGPAELEQRNLLYVSDAFRMTPGITVQPARGFGYVLRGRGGCTPAVYLDGSPVADGADALDQFVTPTSIMAVEIYTAASVPPQFGGIGAAGCGAVVIWTKR
jgi:hypothetical protein